jgi:CPA2 family monovalent cation:H+ antiporter-2
MVAGLRTQEVFIAIILLSVLGTAWATEQVGLSMTLGAFLAGLMLAETEFRHQVEVDIRPFQGLLMGLFFITIGMSLDLGFVVRHIGVVVALTVVLLVIKAAIIFALTRWLMGLSAALSLRIGLILAQGGEFALVLVAVAVRDDLVPGAVSQLMLAIVTLSMAATPFLAMFGRWLGTRLERSVAIGLAALEQENIDLVNHVIIAGFGRSGQTIARIAESHRIPYVVLDLNPARVEEGRAKGLPIFYGDASRPELLWGVGIDRARAFVSSMDGEPSKLTQLVGLLHRRLPELQILVRARDSIHAAALQRAGATAAVPDVLVSSLHLARSMVSAFGLPPTEMADLIEEIQKEAPPQAAE